MTEARTARQIEIHRLANGVIAEDIARRSAVGARDKRSEAQASMSADLLRFKAQQAFYRLTPDEQAAMPDQLRRTIGIKTPRRYVVRATSKRTGRDLRVNRQSNMQLAEEIARSAATIAHRLENTHATYVSASQDAYSAAMDACEAYGHGELDQAAEAFVSAAALFSELEGTEAESAQAACSAASASINANDDSYLSDDAVLEAKAAAIACAAFGDGTGTNRSSVRRPTARPRKHGSRAVRAGTAHAKTVDALGKVSAGLFAEGGAAFTQAGIAHTNAGNTVASACHDAAKVCKAAAIGDATSVQALDSAQAAVGLSMSMNQSLADGTGAWGSP